MKALLELLAPFRGNSSDSFRELLAAIAVAAHHAPCPVRAETGWAYTRRVFPGLTKAIIVDILRVLEGARSDPFFLLRLGDALWAVPERFCADPPLGPKAPGFMAARIVEATLSIRAAHAAPRITPPRINVAALRLPLRRHPQPKAWSTPPAAKNLNQNGYGSMVVVLAGGYWLLVRMMAGWWLLAARKDDGVFCGGLLAARQRPQFRRRSSSA